MRGASERHRVATNRCGGGLHTGEVPYGRPVVGKSVWITLQLQMPSQLTPFAGPDE